MKFITFVVCVISVASATRAISPATAPARNPATRYTEKAAKHEAKAATLAANPQTPTTQQLLHPDKPPAFDNAAKAMEGFKVPQGFKVSVFAAEPQLQNPVALWIDEKSRFWVVETFRFDGGGPGWGVYDIRHRYHLLDEDLASKTVEQRLATINKWNNNDLHRLTEWPDRVKKIEDRDGDGRADHFSTFAQWQEPLDGVASGVITRGDDVYVANIPNLYLLKDTDKDGVADSSQILSTGYGVRYSLLGHDLHGLRWGPDGKLYFSMGDRGAHVKTREGTIIDLPDEGCVLRCDPDGSNLEVFARGLRNPQKLVFDQYGNLFTGDNNCDYGDPARWVYVVEGGDSGWRIGYQHIQTPRPTGPWLAEQLYMPQPDNTAAYLIPPVAHLASGPSGCTYYPGVGLPENYNEHFFLTDFVAGPASLVHSFAMKPKGAGFELVDHGEFLKGCVVTDIEFAPDCNAYVTDWASGFEKTGRGRIYRISAPEVAKSEKVAQTKKLIAEGPSACGFAELKARLAHPDMRVRQAAQFELAARGPESIPTLSQALDASNPRLARIHAIWAFGQIAHKSSDATTPLIPLLDDKNDEIRAQAAKVLGESQLKAASAPLVKRLADESLRVRFFAAMALGRLKSRDAVPGVLTMLEANADKDVYVRHAGVMALAGINDDTALLAAAGHSKPAVRMGVVLALRQLRSPQVGLFLHDERKSIAMEAARAINDAPIEAAEAELAAMTDDVNLPEPILLRALHANFRRGAADNAKLVAAFAARADAPEILRVEALAMLKEWDNPRGIDRVTGIWRPLPKRDESIAQKAARPLLPGIVTTAPDSVRLAAIEVLKKVGVDDPNILFKLATDKEIDPAAAAATLSAMEALKDPRLNEAVDINLATGRGAARTRAIKLLPGRSDAQAKLLALLDSAATDQQAALQTIGGIDAPWAQDVIAKKLDDLVAGKLAPELQLELLEAADKSKVDAIKAKRKQFDDARPKDNILASYSESLVGGDASIGRKIFLERQDVACLRCHKLDGQGGVAGPDLTGVASRHERAYFLESIVNPNAQIAPGFEAVTVQVKAGKSYAGVVTAESDAQIVIDAGDGATIHVDKKEVASRTKGLSPMPQDISKALNKRDLRDIVEFLSTLKQPTTQPATTRIALP